MLIDVNNCIKVFMQYHFHIIYHFPVVEIQAILQAVFLDVMAIVFTAPLAQEYYHFFPVGC